MNPISQSPSYSTGVKRSLETASSQSNSLSLNPTTTSETGRVAKQAKTMLQPVSVNLQPIHSANDEGAPLVVEDFLAKVANESSFVEAMNQLHQHLKEAPSEKKQQTLNRLKQVQSQLGDQPFAEQYHFKFADDNNLMAGCIEFKSVFSSEEWSKVMADGIKSATHAINNKEVVDVGCGNFCFGTVAKAAGATSAIGVDINPDAILNSKINQIIRYGQETDAVSTSDLLGHLIDNGTKVDTIIACIPQIVNFNTSATEVSVEQLAQTTLADRERVSHQTAPAGGEFAHFDLYGLGLLARLLDQAPQVLKPEGRILLNVAGRPGEAIINNLFETFNYDAKPLVKRVFAQQWTGDETVDISGFVNLEAEHNITFNFFKDSDCHEPLSATSADTLLKQKQPVYHELTCFELSPKDQ